MATVTLTSGATLEIEEVLYAFVRDEVVTGTGWTVDEVLRILGELVEEFDPKNRELLIKRLNVSRKSTSITSERGNPVGSPPWNLRSKTP